MKILVTGFDPFGGEKINPAYEAVKLLPDNIGGAQIIKKRYRQYSVKAAVRWKRQSANTVPTVLYASVRQAEEAVFPSKRWQ